MQNAECRPDHLLVIDPRVAGWPSHLISAGPDAIVLILDAKRDGLQQIIEVAAERAPVSGITLVGHGSPGLLLLGQTVIEATALASLSISLKKLASSLSDDARIRLLGLPGAGASGRYLAHILAGSLSRSFMTDRMAVRPVFAVAGTEQQAPVSGSAMRLVTARS